MRTLIVLSMGLAACATAPQPRATEGVALSKEASSLAELQAKLPASKCDAHVHEGHVSNLEVTVLPTGDADAAVQSELSRGYRACLMAAVRNVKFAPFKGAARTFIYAHRSGSSKEDAVEGRH